MQLYLYFVSQYNEFRRNKSLCCFSTGVYYCKHIFLHQLSPETFGYSLGTSYGRLVRRPQENQVRPTQVNTWGRAVTSNRLISSDKRLLLSPNTLEEAHITLPLILTRCWSVHAQYANSLSTPVNSWWSCSASLAEWLLLNPPLCEDILPVLLKSTNSKDLHQVFHLRTVEVLCSHTGILSASVR
jgi:hypothetical protein